MSTLVRKINIRKIKIILSVSIVLLLLYYVYLINTATINAAIAEKNQNKIEDLQSEISELEFDFIEINKNLNEEDLLTFNLNQNINLHKGVVYVRYNENTRLTFNAQE